MGDDRMPRRVAAILLASAMLICGAQGEAIAGPPYFTDDPEPTDAGHWEVYSFLGGTRTEGATEGESGLDINYGLAKNLQLTVVVPFAYERERRTRGGLADVEVALKYRLVSQREGSWIPDIAFFPALTVPTARRGFGSGRVGISLPVWMQKDIGKWSLFGGGAYSINPGQGRRNAWSAGLGISRTFGPRLEIGAEIYRQAADEQGERAHTSVGIGATYRLSRRWSLLASAGPGLESGHREGRSNFYAALKLDY